MKGAIVFMVSTVLMVSSVKGYCQAGDDIATLKKLNEAFLNAIVKRDTVTLSSVLADDFVLINPGGKKQNKADNLANAISQTQTIVSVHIDSVEARLIDANVGTITAWTTFVIKVGEKETTGKNCYQDVYARRANGWKAVSAHVTLLGIK